MNDIEKTKTTSEVVEQWNKDWNEFEPSITYRNDPNYGMIEFFIDGKLITTWSYEDDPHAALEEFRSVVKVGFMIGRQTACIELPEPIEFDDGHDEPSHHYWPAQVKAALRLQGYQCRMKGE